MTDDMEILLHIYYCALVLKWNMSVEKTNNNYSLHLFDPKATGPLGNWFMLSPGMLRHTGYIGYDKTSV